METQNYGNVIIRSVFTGLGIAILYLLIGTVLDYFVTQVLSQFILADCSEDCYFRYFNVIFLFVVLASIIGGIRGGLRAYKRGAEKA